MVGRETIKALPSGIRFQRHDTYPHRFVTDVAQEIPDSQVHSGDGLHRQTFTAVVDSGSEHLVPARRDV